MHRQVIVAAQAVDIDWLVLVYYARLARMLNCIFKRV
jgi:hypothetical protein